MGVELDVLPSAVAALRLEQHDDTSRASRRSKIVKPAVPLTISPLLRKIVGGVKSVSVGDEYSTSAADVREEPLRAAPVRPTGRGTGPAVNSTCLVRACSPIAVLTFDSDDGNTASPTGESSCSFAALVELRQEVVGLEAAGIDRA